jgi:hypothetical protein
MVRILQRCPQYTEFIYDEPQKDPSKLLLLDNDVLPLDDGIKRLFPNQRKNDPKNIHEAREIAEHEEPIPVGILYKDSSKLCYETLSTRGMGMSVEEKIDGFNQALDVFAC